MLKIINAKLAQFHEQYPPTELRMIIDDKSETGRPYVARVNAIFNPQDGWLENAELIEMEPLNEGEWDAVPEVDSSTWVKAHFQEIGDAARVQ